MVIHNLEMNHPFLPTAMIKIIPFLHRKETMMTMMTIIFLHLVHLHLLKGIHLLTRTLERENKEQIRHHLLQRKSHLRMMRKTMTSKRLLKCLKLLKFRKSLNLDALGMSGKYLLSLAMSMGNNGTPLK